MGIGIMIVTFVLHAKKKLTVNLAVTWELLGIAAILSGAVPRFSGWSSRIGLGSLVVLLITALLVLWGVYQMTIQISSLLMKNQELAILVSLLNQENERILRELEKLTAKMQESYKGIEEGRTNEENFVCDQHPWPGGSGNSAAGTFAPPGCGGI